MLKIFSAIILLLISISVFAAEEATKCNPAGYQLELNACARDDFVNADKALNETYQALIQKGSGDGSFVSKLRQSQKAWLAFRDADIEAQFACNEDNERICWGSMYPMSLLSRKAQLTYTRTKQLQEILQFRYGEP